MNKMSGEFRKRYRRCKRGIDDFVRFVNLPRVSGRSKIGFLLRKMSEIRAFSEAVTHIPICGSNIRRFRWSGKRWMWGNNLYEIELIIV